MKQAKLSTFFRKMAPSSPAPPPPAPDKENTNSSNRLSAIVEKPTSGEPVAQARVMDIDVEEIVIAEERKKDTVAPPSEGVVKDAAVPPIPPSEGMVKDAAAVLLNKGETVIYDDDKISDSSNNELSSYEQIRLENIRKNEAFLASLGLDSVLPRSSQPVSKPKNPGKKRGRSPNKSILPARRSSRVACLSALVDYTGAGVGGEGEDEGSEESEEEKEEDFDTPDVVRYILKSGEDAYGSVKHAPEEVLRLRNEARYSSLALLKDDPIGTAQLPAIYSLSFLSSSAAPLALLTAGKGGMVALFNDPLSMYPANHDDEAVAPYTFQAHSRWVSTARFLHTCTLSSLSASSTFPLITASDDATIKIWDLGRAGKSKPKLLSSSNQVHNRGVFGMEIVGDMVVTGSKDKTVAVSQIDPAGGPLQLLSRYDELHSSVVKAVDLQANGKVFASGSQDRSVCVVDTRDVSASRGRPQIKLENCCEGGVYCAQFSPHPQEQHLLMTAGLDPVIKLWDLRYMKKQNSGVLSPSTSTGSTGDASIPLFTFKGHCTSGARLKSIVPPTFLGSRTIVTGGQGSGRLSIYCTTTGRTLSRGTLPEDPSNCAVSIGPHGALVAASCRGNIYFLRAQIPSSPSPSADSNEDWNIH